MGVLQSCQPSRIFQDSPGFLHLLPDSQKLPFFSLFMSFKFSESRSVPWSGFHAIITVDSYFYSQKCSQQLQAHNCLIYCITVYSECEIPCLLQVRPHHWTDWKKQLATSLCRTMQITKPVPAFLLIMSLCY